MGFIATYELDRPINVIRGQLHVVVGAGRYQTADVNVQRVLNGYPGVRRVSLELEAQAPPAGGEALGSRPAPPAETGIKTVSGLQFKPTRERGGRVVAEDEHE
jgi:hypothetical protein